ncbi:MAG: S24/S26 family peptidase [Clostridia bacterium]|nr:S24/S26 family peptidase [Clostridia bacterium]
MKQDPSVEVSRREITEMLLSAEDGAEMPLLVTGLSMTPFLFHKISVVYLKKSKDYVPRKGDIVFFARRDTTLVLHRIVRIEPDGTLVIKGDAQRWRETITADRILASVTHIQRRKRIFSVENKGYRFLVALWSPLRWLHPPLAYCLNALGRLPYKLSRK